ncbi:MAG: thermonuclease family protein [Acidimicrobiia bacterium]|nr:thermonuclease family protein [Acidimicrobiia bacterium]
MRRADRTIVITGLVVLISSLAVAQTAPKRQTRPHGTRIAVPPALLQIDDGDTVEIHWSRTDHEIVRILGIDTPETRHPAHNLPYGQAFGEEARAFARGAFAVAGRVELMRASTIDPFDRTLGYLFIDGRNYSTMILKARLAAESITPFGDNGFPREAAEVMDAAKAQGPLPFEPPHVFRARMRDLSDWLRARGEYPDR